MFSDCQLQDYYATLYSTSQARLNAVAKDGLPGAWVAKSSEKGEYIEADLEITRELIKIATQGRQDKAEWVTSYYLSYGTDGINYKYVVDAAGSTKTFTGNNDQNMIVEHPFDVPLSARYVRLYPQTWFGWDSLRWGIFGCGSSKF